MITNPSAKSRFLNNTVLVGKHQDMVHEDIFQLSADAALLEYQEELQFNSQGDLNKSAASFLRLLGAREFLFILRNLGEKDVPLPKQRDIINLETRKA